MGIHLSNQKYYEISVLRKKKTNLFIYFASEAHPIICSISFFPPGFGKIK